MLLKRWETASQMRKWTQSIKLTISERTAADAEQAFRDSWNEANPSQDPITGMLSAEQRAEVDKKAFAAFEEQLDKTYADVVEKAKLLLILQVPEAYKKNRSVNRLNNQVSVINNEEKEEDSKIHILIDRSE